VLADGEADALALVTGMGEVVAAALGVGESAAGGE